MSPAGSHPAVATAATAATLATRIDARQVSWVLSGWFGGFADQRDLASLAVTFVDSRGGTLGRALTGPVLAGDRGSTTRLNHRLATGTLPPMTRRIAVRLSAEAGSGDNDGYADELSIVLRRR